MQSRHAAVSKVHRVRRGSCLEAWAYGYMVPIGSRSASGGRAGDFYGKYTYMPETKDVSDIKLWFGYAQVCLYLFLIL